MSTPQKLVQLSNDGELGRLLAEKFNGQVGHTSGRKDADFLVIFESEEKTPVVEKISEIITGHYTGLGFKVKVVYAFAGELSLMIICDESQGLAYFTVTITTLYPHGGRANTLRATTHMVA
jgi:hypothetical protein